MLEILEERYGSKCIVSRSALWTALYKNICRKTGQMNKQIDEFNSLLQIWNDRYYINDSEIPQTNLISIQHKQILRTRQCTHYIKSAWSWKIDEIRRVCWHCTRVKYYQFKQGKEENKNYIMVIIIDKENTHIMRRSACHRVMRSGRCHDVPWVNHTESSLATKYWKESTAFERESPSEGLLWLCSTVHNRPY